MKCRHCRSREFEPSEPPIHFPFPSPSGKYTGAKYVVCKDCVKQRADLFQYVPDGEPEFGEFSFTVTYDEDVDKSPVTCFSLVDLKGLCEDYPVLCITVMRTGPTAWKDKEVVCQTFEEAQKAALVDMPQLLVPTDAWYKEEKTQIFVKRHALKRQKQELKQ